MRIVTLIFAFFLVQVLVRLFQYCLRLSAFWDSQADAVLLAASFSNRKGNPGFDGLVSTLSPAVQDFKPMPKSWFDAFLAKVSDTRGKKA